MSFTMLTHSLEATAATFDVYVNEMAESTSRQYNCIQLLRDCGGSAMAVSKSHVTLNRKHFSFSTHLVLLHTLCLHS